MSFAAFDTRGGGLVKGPRFPHSGAIWLRRRTGSVWCAPWLVSRPR